MVIVVVVTGGGAGGVVVVVTSEVTVRVTGVGAHPATNAVQAIIAVLATIIGAKCDLAAAIVGLPQLRFDECLYRTVVVSVVRRVVVVSPYGETVVPLVVVLLWSVTTPFSSTVRRVVVSVTGAGTGTTTGAVVWYVVVDVVVCAMAAPVINERTVVAASQDLVMSRSPMHGP